MKESQMLTQYESILWIIARSAMIAGRSKDENPSINFIKLIITLLNKVDELYTN